MDKEVFKNIEYGLYIVSSRDDKDVGCVINTLMQLTSNNPIISICLNKENYTNQVIKKKKKFIVSILSKKVDPKIIGKFGFSSSKDIDKFAKENYREVENIKVLNDGICGYLVCDVINIVDVDSHDLFIARVIDTKMVSNDEAMSYKYYHDVIKGKTSVKAPTYIEEEVEDDFYVCELCGYVHKGKPPKGFKCPICGADFEHFKKKGN